jgi:putative transposase
LSVAARLEDAPRPGGPCRITGAPACRRAALACAAPAAPGRPSSQWSARELADEVVRRGIVDASSPRHAARLLESNGLGCQEVRRAEPGPASGRAGAAGR